MAECDEVAEGMRDAFFAWIEAEDRELSLYSARGSACHQMVGESSTIRENVTVSLYRSAYRHVDDHLVKARIETMDHPMAGSW
jgi:predicted short-subunit dehydrogenase-like oxidoreductase (DUF2520 family)